MNVEKLRRLQAQVRIGGKGTPRRKKKVTHQSAATDDKKLQSSLKKLSVSTIPGIEEVNIIKDDLTVIHFNNPKAQASLSANTFAVTGHGESKKIVEMLPEILPQLGQETVMQLRMFANTMSQGANKNVGSLNGENSNILSKVAEEDDDEVPLLVNDFEQVAKLEEASKAVKTTKIVTFDADVPYDKELSNDGIQSKNIEQKVEDALNSTELLTHKSQEAMTQCSKDENKGKKSNNKQQQQQQIYAHDGEAKNKTETAKVKEDKKIRQIKIEKPGKQEIKTSTAMAGAAAKNTKKEHDNQKILAAAKVKDSAAAKDVKTNETLKQTSNKKDRDITDELSKPEQKHTVKEDPEMKPCKVKANESKPVKDKSEGKNEKLQESNKSKKSEKVEKKSTEENKKAKKSETEFFKSDNNDKALNKKLELAKCCDHEQKKASVKSDAVDAADATKLKTETEPKEDKVSQEHSSKSNAKPSTVEKEIKKSELQNDKKVSNEASDKNKESKLENTTKGKVKAAKDNTKIKEDKLTMATQQKEASSAQNETSSQAPSSASKKGDINLKLDINKAKQSVTASNKSPTNRTTPQPKPQTTRKSPAKNVESPILAPKLSPPTKSPTPQPKPPGKKPTTPPDVIHEQDTKNKDITQKPDEDLEIKKCGSVSETSAEDKALKGTPPLSSDSTPSPTTKGASPIKTNQNVKSQSTVKQTQVTEGAAPKSSSKQKHSKSVTPTKPSGEVFPKPVQQLAASPKENLEIAVKCTQQPTEPTKKSVESVTKQVHQAATPIKENPEVTPKPLQQPTEPTKANVESTPKPAQQPTSPKKANAEANLKLIQQPTKANAPAIPKEVPQPTTTTKAFAEDTNKPVQQPLTSTKPNVDDTPKQVHQPTKANVADAKEVQQSAAIMSVSEEGALKQVQQPTAPTKMVVEDVPKQMEQPTMPAAKPNVVAIPKEVQQLAITTKVSVEDTLKQVQQPPTPTKTVAEDIPKQMKNVTTPTKANVEGIPKQVPQSPQTPTKVNTKSAAATPTPPGADVAPKASQQSTTPKKQNEKSKSKQQQQKKVSASDKECKADVEGKTTSPVKTSDMQIKSSLKTDENELNIQQQTKSMEVLIKSTPPKPTTDLVEESPNSQIPADVSANVEEKNKRTTVSTVSIISVKTESLPSTLPVSEASNSGQMSQQIPEQSTLGKGKQIQSGIQLPTLTKALGDGDVAGRLQDDKNPSQALVLGKPIISTVATGSSQKQDSLAKVVTIPQGSNESRAKLQETSPSPLNPSREQIVLDTNKTTSQVIPDDGKNIMQGHANKEPLLEISGKIEDISKAKSVCPTQSIIAMKDNNQILFSNAPSTPTEALALNLMEEAKKPIIQTKDFAEANLQLLYSQLMMQQSPTDNKLPIIDQPISKTDMKITLPEGQSIQQTLNQQSAQMPAEPFQQMTTASTVPKPTNQPPSADSK